MTQLDDSCIIYPDLISQRSERKTERERERESEREREREREREEKYFPQI